MRAERQAAASVIGIDLSGPSNTADTAVVRFAVNGRELSLLEYTEGASDEELLAGAQRAAALGPLVVGLDAPLSYNPGGGYRPGDAALSRIAVEAGLPASTVMAPTMTRMAYLTLRGITVARLLETISPAPRITEVHPGICLALNGAASGDIRAFKGSPGARNRLLDWLERQGLSGVSELKGAGDHLVAACAASFAAWNWSGGRSRWLLPSQPPFHPYDYAC